MILTAGAIADTTLYAPAEPANQTMIGELGCSGAGCYVDASDGISWCTQTVYNLNRTLMKVTQKTWLVPCPPRAVFTTQMEWK